MCDALDLPMDTCWTDIALFAWALAERNRSMIINRWRCNQCAVVTETDGTMRATAPNNPPLACLRCGQKEYGFRHEGAFINGHKILSETVISEREIPPDDEKT
jgi:hypothetical protein